MHEHTWSDSVPTNKNLLLIPCMVALTPIVFTPESKKKDWRSTCSMTQDMLSKACVQYLELA